MALRNSKSRRCCVLGCPSNVDNRNCKYHKFPTDIDSCQKWKFALKLIGTISDEHHVCDAHFADDDFVAGNGKPKSKRQLKKDAQPTLNLPREHTYMKFGNPKRGRVNKQKVVKRAEKMVSPAAPSEPLSFMIKMPVATYSRKSVPSEPWRKSRTAPEKTRKSVPSDPWGKAIIAPGQTASMCQDPLALGTNKTQDPLALFPVPNPVRTANVCPPDMYIPNSRLCQVDIKKVTQKSKNSPQETTTPSTNLMLAQKILEGAINIVDNTYKEINNAITINEQFSIPSESTEKITIQTQDDKVMELLLVKSIPKISNKVNEDFKVIDKFIDNTQAVLSQDINVTFPVHHKSTQTERYALEEENRRLKMEILSLKCKLDKMQGLTPKNGIKMRKKVVFGCKDPGASPFKKLSMSPASKKQRGGTPPTSKKPEASPSSKKSTMHPTFRITATSPKVVEAYQLPKITCVTSLNGDAIDVATSTNGFKDRNFVVDLTD